MHALDETAAQLQGTIKNLRKIMKAHASALQKHEAATRCALVDPMLQAWGWDVTDPAVVTPEYRASGFGKAKTYADYALFVAKHGKRSPRKPSVIVEVKKFRSPDPLMGQAERDALIKATKTKAKYYAFTDGNRWWLCTVGAKTIMSFRLDDPKTSISALSREALPLERSYLGKVTNFVDLNLVPLTKAYQTFWKPAANRIPSFTVQIPGHVKKTTTSWRGLSRVIIDWLDQNRFLDGLTEIPFEKNRPRLFLNTRPRHATGDKFRTRYHARISGLYFEMYASPNSLMQSIINLLEKVGQNPNAIHIKISNKD